MGVTGWINATSPGHDAHSIFIARFIAGNEGNVALFDSDAFTGILTSVIGISLVTLALILACPLATSISICAIQTILTVFILTLTPNKYRGASFLVW